LFAQSPFSQTTTQRAKDEAHTLQMRINPWLAPYRDEKAGEFYEWLSMTMEPDATPAGQHPIASRIQRFVAEHSEEYIRLREVDLRRYPALGYYLSNYELASDFQDNMKKELQGELGPIDDELNRLQYIANHRSL